VAEADRPIDVGEAHRAAEGLSDIPSPGNRSAAVFRPVPVRSGPVANASGEAATTSRRRSEGVAATAAGTSAFRPGQARDRHDETRPLSREGSSGRSHRRARPGRLGRRPGWVSPGTPSASPRMAMDMTAAFGGSCLQGAQWQAQTAAVIARLHQSRQDPRVCPRGRPEWRSRARRALYRAHARHDPRSGR
jgi:hypothetical protein